MPIHWSEHRYFQSGRSENFCLPKRHRADRTIAILQFRDFRGLLLICNIVRRLLLRFPDIGLFHIGGLRRDFFLTGDERNLKPMILKDVAERAGYDISTISRASNSKYVQTNFGIYPLKYFFSESMQNDAGEEVSTREIKRLLEELVDHEDKHKPLSDDKLCELLQQKGYPIARRTIAKYREQLSIPVARLRKEI